MTQKIIVAKEGFDALTETNPNNLIFSSDYNTLKYESSGTKTITIPANANPYEVEYTIVLHGLGYYPFFVVMAELPELEAYFNLPYSFADAGVYYHMFVYATVNTLVLRVVSTGSDEVSINIGYKVFRNNLNL
jgi:hypothetical protein